MPIASNVIVSSGYRRRGDTFSEPLTRKQRTITQICEMLLNEGVEAYKKEGPKFMQR